MTDTARFELFSYWRSSAVYRVRVAMNLKGVARRETNVDIDAGEQLGDAYRGVNPLGGIPSLVDHAQGAGALPMSQSLAILEFLDETHPQPPLLPADPHGRARVRSIAQMLTADTHPLITPRVRKYLTSAGGFDADAWRAWQIQWFGAGLRAVEKRLASEAATGRFCHGDAVTSADICLASLFTVMRVFKIDFDDIPTCKRIMAECEALDAFAAADPMRQVGAPKAA